MEKKLKDTEENFKTYFIQTVSQEWIRVLPGANNNIKLFIHWVSNDTRMGIYPYLIPLPVLDPPNCIHMYNTHNMFVSKSKTLTDVENPDKFTCDINFQDQLPQFKNCLHIIPGRNRKTLVCVIQHSPITNASSQPSFLENYVDMVMLTGEDFTMDLVKVKTFKINLIYANGTS